MVKTTSITRNINVVLLNININQPKLVNLCEYKLATNWVKILQDVLEATLFLLTLHIALLHCTHRSRPI